MDTNELRKAAIAVFLATEAAVAQDLSDKLNGAADEIDRLREEGLHKPCVCKLPFGFSNYCLIHGDIMGKAAPEDGPLSPQ